MSLLWKSVFTEDKLAVAGMRREEEGEDPVLNTGIPFGVMKMVLK